MKDFMWAVKDSITRPVPVKVRLELVLLDVVGLGFGWLRGYGDKLAASLRERGDV